MKAARLPACLVLAVAPLGACVRERPPTRAPGAEPITTAAKLDNFGYRPGDPKLAVFSDDPGAVVEVRTARGQLAFTVPNDGGSVVSKGRDAASGDSVWWVDFSPLAAAGAYHLYSARLRARSYEFEIAPGVYDEVFRAAVRTFYLQRCGTPKPASRAGPWADERACHRTDAAAAPGAGQLDRGVRDLSGGWHDAGDYNKYLWYAASNAILFMLRAWEQSPQAFPDGGLDLPESGNGLSDLLDEVQWELDFLLKMQLPDGSALSEVHRLDSANGSAPPSADATVRYYRNPTLQSGAVLAGSCALAARVFATAGRPQYAAKLARAARSAWSWLQGQGDSREKVWAAAELFRMDPTLTTARAYVDGYHASSWSGAALEAAAYDTHAALTYLEASGATPAVVAAMRASLGRHVDEVFAADDLYRNGMPERSYHWGSNSIRAAYGVFLLQAARLGTTGAHTAADCRRHALDLLHYFHGQNPLGMVYLTNMASRGGEHSSWQFFHNWFGQVGDSYSREHFVGKPAAVAEPHYPYFDGADNHGVRDDKASLFGPAPGFVPGGPNRDYSGDSVPPARAVFPNRFYRDWNDQKVWTARSWEITESSIGYQGPFVALVAAFRGEAVPPGRSD